MSENKSKGDPYSDVMGMPPGGRPKQKDIVSGIFPDAKAGSAPSIVGADGAPVMSKDKAAQIQSQVDKIPEQKFRVEGDIFYDKESKESVWVTHIWWRSLKTTNWTKVLDLPIGKNGLENVLKQMTDYEKECEETLEKEKDIE